MTRGGANHRVKWQSHFSILRVAGALNTENTVILMDKYNNVVVSWQHPTLTEMPTLFIGAPARRYTEDKANEDWYESRQL